MTWVNDILQGIFLGGAYALTAVGLSLMFGVMRMVNPKFPLSTDP
jgi:branched-chain amino acid transport system permease protein